VQSRKLAILAVIAALAAVALAALALQRSLGRVDRETLAQWGEEPVMISAPEGVSLWVDGHAVDRAPGVDTVIVQLAPGQHELRARAGEADETWSFGLAEKAPPVISVTGDGGGLRFEAR
jgi:hypothetical protein